MFCTKCGESVSPNSKFCGKCGTKNTQLPIKSEIEHKWFVDRSLNIFNVKSAFLVGFLFIFVGQILAGISIILGAFACMSANSRKVFGAKISRTKRLFEVFLLFIILLLFSSLEDIYTKSVENPVVFVLIPAWIFTAYFYSIYEKYFSSNHSKRRGIILGMMLVFSLGISLIYQIYKP